MASALLALGEDDLEALLEEQPILTMACEFCGAEHRLDREAIAAQVRGDEPRH
jgi:redox-regulated HSP33 family molecular chaperone